jgi:hypothetical protein
MLPPQRAARTSGKKIKVESIEAYHDKDGKDKTASQHTEQQ